MQLVNSNGNSNSLVNYTYVVQYIIRSLILINYAVWLSISSLISSFNRTVSDKFRRVNLKQENQTSSCRWLCEKSSGKWVD